MSEGEGTMVDKSESSSFEDLASAAIAEEIEEAKLAEAAAAEKDKSKGDGDSPKPEWQDLLGSGALLKKMIKAGDEESGLRPHRGDIARISYALKIKDSGDFIEKQDNVEIYLGDNETLASNLQVDQLILINASRKRPQDDTSGEYLVQRIGIAIQRGNAASVLGTLPCVIQGLDLALTLMYKGESALLHLAPRFAYGQTGLKAERLGLISDPEKIYNGPIIGPETWIEASLELHDWSEDPDVETLTIEQRMAIGKRRRLRGNWWYSRGESPLAVQLYRRALDVLDEAEGGITDPTPSGDMDITSDALREMFEERLRVHNNMAAAQMMAGAYDAALLAVTRVLSCQPDNAKALYRKSKILSSMGKDAEALEAARAAAAVAPDNTGVKKELQRCEQKATRDRSVERKLAKRMLGATEPRGKGSAPDKKPSRTKMIVWGSLLLSILVGVASVLVYRYKIQQ